eukprot:scaffold173291_cov23-Tisochrysis_lutea.AAC.3
MQLFCILSQPHVQSLLLCSQERRARSASPDAIVLGTVLGTVMQVLVDLGAEAPFVAEKVKFRLLAESMMFWRRHADAGGLSA